MSNVKVRYYQGTINPDDLIVVEPPECKRKVMALCVSESGHITLNDHFLSAIDDRLFDFRTTKDRKIITLKATKDGIYTFPKNGRKKDVDFVRGLSACGLHLPCKYVLKYSEEMNLSGTVKHRYSRHISQVNKTSVHWSCLISFPGWG